MKAQPICYRVTLPKSNSPDTSGPLPNGQYVKVRDSVLYTMAYNIDEAASQFPWAITIAEIGIGWAYIGGLPDDV